MQETTERVDRIARKTDARGASLGPPLTEAELAEFEARTGSTLPEGFRAFVARIGNGGLGPGSGPPDYRLLKLGELPDHLCEEYSLAWQQQGALGRAFPFTRAWIWEDGETSEEGTTEQLADGTLHLGTDGCGLYWLLIMNGPERGNVWMLADVGIGPAEPKVDFLQWYENWLDTIRVWPA